MQDYEIKNEIMELLLFFFLNNWNQSDNCSLNILVVNFNAYLTVFVQDEYDNQNGLVGGQPYSLTDVYENKVIMWILIQIF